ncbi:MAG: hypothetical protein KDK41_05575 [Leptospiraceae bacterium]|nr:hypothetical protein [Leptospiraceae bacterium]
MIFVPFLIYFFIVLLVSALLIPVYHDFHGAVFAAYYLSLLGGYIFYFAGMRIAIRRYLNNQVYFKLIYHLPYYGFLLPALVVSGPVIQYFIDNSIALFFAIAVSTFFQFVFYLAGLWMIKNSADNSETRLKFTYFLPVTLFVPLAAGLAAILIPVSLGNIFWLSIAFSVSLFFSAVFYFAGIFLMMMGTNLAEQNKNEKPARSKYSIPLIIFLIVAILVSIKVIPAYHNRILEISAAYGMSLYGFILAYVALIVWMRFDLKKLS